MKRLNMKSTNGLIIAMLVVGLLAAAFWILALSPKREEAADLGTQVEELKSSLVVHRQEAAIAAEARADFPVNYQRLVVLGKAVPGDDDTASLLVQVNRIAEGADVTFRDIQLASAGGEAEAPVAAPSTAGSSPTEATASLLPLGATIGPAGLGIMRYTLIFDGSFFEIADFINGVDSLVNTKDGEVTVDGRLVTVDGFDLEPAPNQGFPILQATFSVTTYLTPPSQGVAGGATPTSPTSETATPAATTIGAAP